MLAVLFMVVANRLVAYFKVIFALQFAFILLGFFSNCFGSELKKTGSARFNIGVYRPFLYNDVDLKDIEISLNYWMQEVSGDLVLKTTKTQFYEKYQDLSTAFERGNIDMFIAPPLAIAMYFNRGLMAEGFYGKGEHGGGDALLLLARTENVNAISNMMGKKLMLPEHDKLAEIFLEITTFKTYDKSYKQVFSKIETALKAKSIVLSLFFGTTDFALTYKSSFDVMAEMNTQIKSRIKIIKSYPVLSKNMAFMHKDYPHRKLIVDHFKSFAEHPRGQQILNLYQTTEVGSSTVDMLDPFDEIYQQYLSLKIPASQ